VVHVLTPDLSATVCGQDARDWSRAVTIAQLAGLVLRCNICEEVTGDGAK
jgi:hypothetical protein